MSGDDHGTTGERPACLDDPDSPCRLDLGSHGPREIHDHGTTGELDLDAIEDHANKTADQGAGSDPHVVLTLVAEVRRLRALVDRDHRGAVPRAYPGNAVEYGGMVHYVDDDHKTHHPDVTCSCSPTPVWVPRP